MLVELWKDADTYKLGFDGQYEFDLSAEAYDKFVDALELFTKRKEGSYHVTEFDVIDEEGEIE